ncbi:MAG: class I SAM-dependent methyltransferase [Bacteroidia bacterium]|nr:class I SAM-dependent methyltransferase [Bacteroidia bacterium]
MHEPNDELYVFNLCKYCDTVFLTNPVSAERLEHYYTDNYLPYRGAAAWGKYSSFVVDSQKQLDLRRAKFVKKYIDKHNPNINILDVGCGNPSFLEILQQNSTANCTGIDFSDSGWKGKNYPDLELHKVSIEDFKTTIQFDVITLWHYFEHDYDPNKTIEKLYTFLKPGGKLIIEVPDYKNIFAKIQKSHWQGWHSPRHISLVTKKSFNLLFQKDKWKIVQHFRNGTLDAFTLWWLGKMEKKCIHWSGNMANNFWNLVLLKIITYPIFAFEKLFPMGIQILVIEKNK